MKKHMIRLIALLVFASVAMTSCSIEYRQRHGHDRGDRDEHHDRDRDHNDRDHNYRNYNR